MVRYGQLLRRLKVLAKRCGPPTEDPHFQRGPFPGSVQSPLRGWVSILELWPSLELRPFAEGMGPRSSYALASGRDLMEEGVH